MTRFLSCLFLGAALFGAAPAFAQGGKGKAPAKKAPPPPPKSIVYKLDLFRLKAEVNHDGADQKPLSLADQNQYGETRVFGASGKLAWKQRFKGLERLEFTLTADDAIKDLKFRLSHGRMLAPTGLTGRALAPILARETWELSKLFEKIEEGLEDEEDEAVVAEVRKLRSLGWDSSMGVLSARARLLRWRQLKAMRLVENALVDARVIIDTKRPLSELTFDEATSSVIVRLAERFETVVERELWWQVEVDYFFSFGSIGRDVSSGPTAAYVPGSLGRGVSSIAIVSRPRVGKRRVLWFRLPGYNDKDQSFEMKLPEGWVGRLFSPGKESGGALVFVLVPASKRGELEFLWKLNANTGARLRVERPEPSPNPF